MPGADHPRDSGPPGQPAFIGPSARPNIMLGSMQRNFGRAWKASSQVALQDQEVLRGSNGEAEGSTRHNGQPAHHEFDCGETRISTPESDDHNVVNFCADA